MDWSASGAPLVATRAVHFAATAVTAGNIIFRTVVAMPVLRAQPTAAVAFRDHALAVSWLGLVAAMISGAIWLLLQAALMSDLPLGDALTGDVLWSVATDTQFGQVTILRAGIAMGLAACLVCDRAIIGQRLGLLLALAFAASLAWTGHAGATSGAEGYLHLAADTLHLVAAAAWIGSLVPFALLLVTACRSKSISFARDMVERFSRLGVVSVAALALTGLINTVILVGSLRALAATAYGQLLLFKLALFAAMLTLASINRTILTPRLATSEIGALRWLARNSAVEFALGLAIFAVVGLLGVLHPAIHGVN
jgi:putative copper resistance protein D